MKREYMKKPIIVYAMLALLAVLVIALVVDIALGGFKTGWKLWEKQYDGCSYDMELELDPKNHKLYGVMDFKYKNTEEGAMDAVCMLLYANSFRNAGFGAISEDEYYLAYPNGFSFGGIDIESVSSNGKPLEYTIEGSQDNELWITLPEVVQSGDSMKINIEYVVTIPNCLGRFGYGENTISIANCNPILAVFENNAFYNYPYYPMGDPFYSEVADYEVKITVPEDYDIAVTGHVQKQTLEDGKKVYAVDASARRDFAFVASDKFTIVEGKAGGATVRSYYFSPDFMGKFALEAGVYALDIFSTLYGAYAYEDFNIVETDFYIGGMEYPGMVLIDTTLYSARYAGVCEMVVAHEAAHQWWYAAVGNDQVKEPWLDESLAEFSTMMYFRNRYGQDGEAMCQQYVLDSYDMLALMLSEDLEAEDFSINMATIEFDDSTLYAYMVYGMGAKMFDELRKELGDETFFEVMSGYYKDNLYGLADREDLEIAFEERLGTDFTPWFDAQLDE